MVELFSIRKPFLSEALISKPGSIHLKLLNDSAIVLNWKLNSSRGFPITGVLVEWRSRGEIKNIEKSITAQNVSSTTIFAAIPDDSDVRIRLRNEHGYSEFSDSTKYHLATACMYFIFRVKPNR